MASTLTSAYDELTFNLLESNSVETPLWAPGFFQKCLVCFAITAIFLLVYIALRFGKIGGFGRSYGNCCTAP